MKKKSKELFFKRLLVSFTESQIEKLEDLSLEKKITKQELLRVLIDKL